MKKFNKQYTGQSFRERNALSLGASSSLNTTFVLF